MYRQPLLPYIDSEQEAIRQQRRAARQQRRRQRHQATAVLWTIVYSSVLLVGLIGFIYLHIQTTTNTPTYPAINSISCDAMEQTGFHIHVHLTIYINGKRLTIPERIGIAPDGSCFYWMHTHTDDGIIHIEAPQQLHNLALDDFLTLWHDGFSSLNYPSQIDLNTGWEIFVNGKPFTDIVTSPLHTEVPLASHDAITMEYGSSNPSPDASFQFPPNLPR